MQIQLCLALRVQAKLLAQKILVDTFRALPEIKSPCCMFYWSVSSGFTCISEITMLPILIIMIHYDQ